ncbi:MAG TPA: aminotransferase class III-fold pyridoxal phosphate-dependent enzyme, partial [Myxococcota bacterium]|nr:aminotransferase class III-fold pyridoxal phosphate-dependent enzyme [Myxococcota bacterium]
FTNSGSEANELAFLAARQATGEGFIVNLRHSYHGGTSGALAASGMSTWRFRAQPTSSVTSAVEPYCYRCPFNKKPDSCALECAKNVESTIETSTNGKIAALIVEPVMGVGGFISPPQEYFTAVANIAHKYGGKYISDEVQTGMGRSGGEFFLTKELGIDADMITMAKGLGNGAPIGAVLMKTESSESLGDKFHFNTFAGDPYQAAQALATIKIIDDEALIANARKMGAYLKEGLNDLMKRHALIGDVRGRGLLLGLELVKDRVSKAFAKEETVKILEQCRNRGMLIGKGGYRGNVIRIAPPLSIDRAQCERIIEILDQSFSAIGNSAAS